MQLPNEIHRAEVLDWWEDSRESVCSTLEDRIPALYYKVDKVIEEMPVKWLIRKGKFRSEEIEPIVLEWVEKLYRELTHDLDDSLRASLADIEGNVPQAGWSYREMATTGAALTFSVAPIAGVPFFAGGLAVTGIAGIFGGGFAVVPTVALAGSAAALIAGPGVRSKAVKSLKTRLLKDIHLEIDKRIFGDPENSAAPSLKGALMNDLQCVAMKRMENFE